MLLSEYRQNLVSRHGQIQRATVCAVDFLKTHQ
jgi:hypothetical protein